MLLIELLIDFFFLADIALNFNTGYIAEQVCQAQSHLAPHLGNAVRILGHILVSSPVKCCRSCETPLHAALLCTARLHVHSIIMPNP